jgi:hypothetical protein
MFNEYGEVICPFHVVAGIPAHDPSFILFLFSHENFFKSALIKLHGGKQLNPAEKKQICHVLFFSMNLPIPQAKYLHVPVLGRLL